MKKPANEKTGGEVLINGAISGQITTSDSNESGQQVYYPLISKEFLPYYKRKLYELTL